MALAAFVVGRDRFSRRSPVAAGDRRIRGGDIASSGKLRGQLFAHILRLGPSFSRAQKTGELSVAAVDGIEALDAYYSQYLPQLVISVLVPSDDPRRGHSTGCAFGAILMLTAPLIPFFMYMIGRTAEQATSRQYATLGRMSSHLLDSIQGLATLKIFGQAGAHAANIGRVADKFREATLKVLQVSFLSAFALELVATMSTAIIAVEVGLRLLYGHMQFQQALFLLILAPEFYAPLRTLGARFHAGMAGTVAARRIFEVLDTALPSRLETPMDPAQVGSAAARDDVPVAIRFKNVSYAYPGRDHPALDRIHLDDRSRNAHGGRGSQRRRQEHIGRVDSGIHSTYGGRAVGRPGRRRTKPPPGQDESASAGFRRCLTCFTTSIAANIRLGKPEASEHEVLQAVRLAHLDEFIQSLPNGLETVIGEGGARLSSGEAQRLSLARAFLLEAPILVLDEPSSSLDPETEALLDESHSVARRRPHGPDDRTSPEFHGACGPNHRA